MTVADPTPRIGLRRPTTAQAPQRSLRTTGARVGWRWLALGLAGSLTISIAAPPLTGGGWWYGTYPPVPRVICYLGMAAMSAAWLGLGARIARSPAVRPRDLFITAAVWATPLLLAPPLFSRDIYSYLAQGAILHLGHDPYRQSPLVLASLGRRDLLDAVSPFWRGSTAPYGPAFIALMSAVVWVSGSHLVLAVILGRLLEAVGIALLAAFVPRLANRLGGDPRKATWIAVLSPLVLLELLSPGHNDALMVGLMVAGVCIALEGRPGWGIAICALGSTIKFPAAVAAAFIAVAWAWEAPSAAAKVKVLAWSAFLGAVVIAVVSLATGLGLQWVSTSIFSTPARVHLAITPTTALGWTLAPLFGVKHFALGHWLSTATTAATALLGAWLLWKVRFVTVACYLGLLLIVAAFAGPAAWPWYFLWGLALLCADPVRQRSWAIAALSVIAVFMVNPDGNLALTISTSPYVLVFYFVAAVLVLLWARGRLPAARPLAART